MGTILVCHRSYQLECLVAEIEQEWRHLRPRIDYFVEGVSHNREQSSSRFRSLEGFQPLQVPSDGLEHERIRRVAQSHQTRIAFLKNILEVSHRAGLEPVGQITNTHMHGAGKLGEYYLMYFGWRQPGEVTFRLPNDQRYHADVIDTWDMTITPLEGAFDHEFTIKLPTKPYMAIRLRRV